MIAALLPYLTHPAYLLACGLMGILGLRRRGGFFVFLIMALLLTPLGALFIYHIAAERPADPQ